MPRVTLALIHRWVVWWRAFLARLNISTKYAVNVVENEHEAAGVASGVRPLWACIAGSTMQGSKSRRSFWTTYDGRLKLLQFAAAWRTSPSLEPAREALEDQTNFIARYADLAVTMTRMLAVASTTSSVTVSSSPRRRSLSVRADRPLPRASAEVDSTFRPVSDRSDGRTDEDWGRVRLDHLGSSRAMCLSVARIRVHPADR